MDESPLADWTRPYFQPGGGDAFLFYAVFGPTPHEFSISRERYRCDGVPTGVIVSSYTAESSPEALEMIRSGQLWNDLLRHDASLAADISAQSACMLVRGTVADPADLIYLRNIVGLISWLLDNGGIAIYDPQMLKWWTPEEWKKDVFLPNSSSPCSHVVILTSEDGEGGEWFHTRGMRKFGRPDVSIHGVTPALREGVIELCNRFIQLQALGEVIEENKLISMKALPTGMRCSHRGDLDDPDFNNVHVEILWP